MFIRLIIIHYIRLIYMNITITRSHSYIPSTPPVNTAPLPQHPHPIIPHGPLSSTGKSYNIPIGIYLNESHPNFPPITYVKPTSSMELKVSSHVDQTGRVFLPYLHDWNKVYPHPATLPIINITVLFTYDIVMC